MMEEFLTNKTAQIVYKKAIEQIKSMYIKNNIFFDDQNYGMLTVSMDSTREGNINYSVCSCYLWKEGAMQ